ncbi:MAG: NAD-dependent epimerase/dehydratase family protein, partial [Halobacteriota archaeon]
MDKVYVTGGTGFVGCHVCNRFAGEHDVVALSRDPDETATSLDDAVERRKADVTEPASLEFDDADVVVHLVALSPLVQQPEGRHHEVTARGTENVVSECEESEVDHLLHLGALGTEDGGPTAYHEAKAAAEGAVRDSGLDACVVRPSVVYGEGGEFEEFVFSTTTPVVTALPGGGRTRYQPLYVGDLVDMTAVAVDERVTGEFDVAGPDVLSLADVTRLVYRARGGSVRVVGVPMALARLGLGVAEHLPYT